MNKKKCEHKGCHRPATQLVKLGKKHNTLDRQHECCWRCCPPRTSRRRE